LDKLFAALLQLMLSRREATHLHKGHYNQVPVVVLGTGCRFARALEVSVDELLESKKSKPTSPKPNRNILRRLESIESLPSHHQQTVLKTIDTMLKGLKPAS